MGDEFAGGFEVVFRGGEVEGCLAAEVWMGRLVSISYFLEEMGFKQEKEEEGKKQNKTVFNIRQDSLLALTSASLFRSRSTISSASRRLEAIINGVQPDESCVCT